MKRGSKHTNRITEYELRSSMLQERSGVVDTGDKGENPHAVGQHKILIPGGAGASTVAGG